MNWSNIWVGNSFGLNGLIIWSFALYQLVIKSLYSKTCLKWPLKRRPNVSFQDQKLLNAGKKYCRMLLQYFWPALTYHMAFRPLFCLFLSGCFRQVSPNQIIYRSYHLLHFSEILQWMRELYVLLLVNILQGCFINNSCYFKSLQALILQFLKQIIYLMNIIYCELSLLLIGIGYIM